MAATLYTKNKDTLVNFLKTINDRKAKQTYFYNRSAKELSRLEPGDPVRIKPETDSRTWTKANEYKEVDNRSYKVRTEDGRTYRRNRMYLRLTSFREPFHTARFPDLSTSLHHQDQPVTSPRLSDCLVPKPISVEIPESPTVA